MDNGYAKLRNRESDKIDADTRCGEFFVDDADVLVYYEIGPNADMYRKSFESLRKHYKEKKDKRAKMKWIVSNSKLLGCAR